jgi:hypothetical protein
MKEVSWKDFPLQTKRFQKIDVRRRSMPSHHALSRFLMGGAFCALLKFCFDTFSFREPASPRTAQGEFVESLKMQGICGFLEDQLVRGVLFDSSLRGTKV